MSEMLDVAIIGAGVSGVYCGWRLLDTGTRKSVTVFEASERVGGRLLSVEPPGMPGTRAELGGMRILPATQPRIAWLVERFGIETYPFPVDEPRNIAYLRGEHLRLSDFSDPAKVPYRLSFNERGKTAGTLVIEAIEQIVPGITAMSQQERRTAVRSAKFRGKPLYQQGFWQVLYQVMSPEAYALAVDAGGYLSTLSSWNAADAIPWYLSDFGVDAEYHAFTGGFQQVPLEVASAFEAAGGTIELGTKLVRFDACEGGYALTFADGTTRQAAAVILAMPRRSLELIEPSGVVMGDPEAQQLMASVTPQPLFKLFCAYGYPWWTAAGVEAGRTVTNLPIRQTYYWPTPDGSPRESGRSLLMASYDDGDNIDFWTGFRQKRGVDWMDGALAKRFVGHHALFEDAAPAGEAAEGAKGAVDTPPGGAWGDYRPTVAMVEEIQRQAASVHDLSFVPHPYAAAFMDWGDDPYGGGWNAWNVGVESWAVEAQIVQPVEGVAVYICGEAYSSAQGWVEGALDTADAVLEKGFGIVPGFVEAEAGL